MRVPSSFTCLSLVALLFLPSHLHAAPLNEPPAAKVPPMILEGLHQLADQKPDEAEKAWFRGSPSEGLPVPTQLRYLLEESGKYQNFDVVSVQDITPRLRILYLALNFETRPEIVKFVTYHTLDGWILLSRKFDIDEQLFESVAQPELRPGD